MEQSVINLFDENLVQDFLIQGLLLTTFIALGLSLIFRETMLFYKEFGFEAERQEIKKGMQEVLSGIEGIVNFFLKKDQDKVKKKKHDRQWYWIQIIHLVLVLCLSYVILVTSGIIGNRLGDIALDNSNFYHFGLKSLWVEESKLIQLIEDSDTVENSKKCNSKSHLLADSSQSYNKLNCLFESLKISGQKSRSSNAGRMFKNLTNIDGAIKLITYDDVFPQKKDSCIREKLSEYHYIKHKLLKEPIWQKYIMPSQRLINYSQVLLLSFLFLLCLLYFDFWLAICISYKRISKEMGIKNGHTWIKISFPVIIIFYLCFLYVNQEWVYIFWGPIIIPLLYGAVFYILFLMSGKKNRVVTTIVNYRILGIWVCIFSYMAVGISWRENENEFDYKLYDVYKVHFSNPSQTDNKSSPSHVAPITKRNGGKKRVLLPLKP